MWYLYMLLCDNFSFYIGITNNLAKRFEEHKNKQNISTKEFSSIELIYCEKYQDKIEASKREKQLKGWSRAKKQMLVNGKLGINTCTEFAEELLGKRSLS